MSECKCNLRTRLVGDGCQHCNPAMHAEALEQRCEDLEAEVARLRLTAAERTAIKRLIEDYEQDGEPASDGVVATLRGLLERTK